jgi:hypothetical protein
MAMGLRFVGFGLTILCLSSLTACETKISQCNQLITIVNRTTDDLAQIQTNAKVNIQNSEQMVAGLDQFVRKLEKNTQEMDAIGVDQPLQPHKQRLVSGYKVALKNSRDLVAAVRAKNQPVAQKALNALTANGPAEAQTLKEFQAYCQAPQ